MEQVDSSSGSESSTSESGDVSESDREGSVSSLSSASSRSSKGKKHRYRHLELFKGRKMKAEDANALSTAMMGWDAGATEIGLGAMLLFQGVVPQLEKATSSKKKKKKKKKKKLSTLERPAAPHWECGSTVEYPRKVCWLCDGDGPSETGASADALLARHSIFGPLLGEE